MAKDQLGQFVDRATELFPPSGGPELLVEVDGRTFKASLANLTSALAQPCILLESGSAAKISALPLDSAIDFTEVIPVLQTGVNKQLALFDILLFIFNSFPESNGYLLGGLTATSAQTIDSVPTTIDHFELIQPSLRISAIVAATITLTLSWTDDMGSAQSQLLDPIGGVTMNAIGTYLFPAVQIRSQAYMTGGANTPVLTGTLVGVSATYEIDCEQTIYRQ